MGTSAPTRANSAIRRNSGNARRIPAAGAAAEHLNSATIAG